MNHIASTNQHVKSNGTRPNFLAKTQTIRSVSTQFVQFLQTIIGLAKEKRRREFQKDLPKTNSKMASIEDIGKLLLENNKVIKDDIKQDIDAAKQEVLTSLDKTLLEQQKQIKGLTEKVAELEVKFEKQDDINLQKELSERRHNIILYKIEENEPSREALLTAIVKLLDEAIEDEIQTRDIDYLYRMGKKKEDGSRRPIIVRFTSLHKKEAVLRNWKYFVSKKIEVYEDFPKEVRERRKEILPWAKILKKKGMKATVRVDRLFVNGEYWTLSRAQEFVDEPPTEMQEMDENSDDNSPSNSKKRDRSSPMTESGASSIPKSTLPTSTAEKINDVFLVPSPIISSPRLKVPFVTTPQKNVQYTTIVNHD